MDNLTPCEGREAHARERPVKQSNGPHAANIPSLATEEQRQQRAIHERRSVTFPLHSMTHEERNKVLADLKRSVDEKKEKARANARKYKAEHKAQIEANRRRFKEAHPNYFKEYHKMHKEWWRKGGKYY